MAWCIRTSIWLVVRCSLYHTYALQPRGELSGSENLDLRIQKPPSPNPLGIFGPPLGYQKMQKCCSSLTTRTVIYKSVNQTASPTIADFTLNEFDSVFTAVFCDESILWVVRSYTVQSCTFVYCLKFDQDVPSKNALAHRDDSS